MNLPGIGLEGQHPCTTLCTTFSRHFKVHLPVNLLGHHFSLGIETDIVHAEGGKLPRIPGAWRRLFPHGGPVPEVLHRDRCCTGNGITWVVTAGWRTGDEAAKEKYLRERRKVLPRGTKRRLEASCSGLVLDGFMRELGIKETISYVFFMFSCICMSFEALLCFFMLFPAYPLICFFAFLLIGFFAACFLTLLAFSFSVGLFLVLEVFCCFSMLVMFFYLAAFALSALVLSTFTFVILYIVFAVARNTFASEKR